MRLFLFNEDKNDKKDIKLFKEKYANNIILEELVEDGVEFLLDVDVTHDDIIWYDAIECEY